MLNQVGSPRNQREIGKRQDLTPLLDPVVVVW